MPARVLITGASGFTGRFLAHVALAHGSQVFGLSRNPLPLHGVTSLPVDLLQRESVAAAVQQAQPDYIFHLAAQTPANRGRHDDESWLTYNQLTTFHLFEAVRAHCPSARILLASSSAIYGHVAEHLMPITEQLPFQPTTLYGFSKASQELLAMRYVSEHGLAIIRARPFNQVGPGEPLGMLTSTLAAQVARIRAGAQPAVVRMWHRATQRDFTDIRDTVQAYWSLIANGRPGDVYNICSGVAVPIGTLVESLLAIAGIEASIEETGGPPRPGDILTQVGSFQKLYAATGWQPVISLQQTLADLLASFP
jgi:GDP-4-dehydro-6-deoxy-D-mannose reductase